MLAYRSQDAFPVLMVADMRRSLGFYCRLIGFDLSYAFPSADDPQFASTAARSALASAVGGSNASTAIWFYIDDVDAAVAGFRDGGVPVVAEPDDQPWVSAWHRSRTRTAISSIWARRIARADQSAQLRLRSACSSARLW